MHFYLCVFLFLAPISLQAGSDTERNEIEARIKPIGKVRVEQQDQSIIAEKKTEKTVARSGQSIYEQHCIVCHQGGLAGAPKFRDKASWQSRFEGRDINALVVSAIQGKNAMPAKGTCQECSDSDIKAAVDYMVPKQ